MPSGKYVKEMLWQTATPGPRMNPLSNVGREFFRSGTWYFRGIRDLILMASPVLVLTAPALSTFLGVGLISGFIPMLASPAILVGFLAFYLITTLTSYLNSTARLGQSRKEVMFGKEAILLGAGWPGYFQAAFWGLLGPSGRLGGITTKGAAGREALPDNYTFFTVLVGAVSALSAIYGSTILALYLFTNGLAALASSIGLGVCAGLFFCSLWAGYHAFMIFRGLIKSQGLGATVGGASKGLGQSFKNLFKW